MLELPDNMLDVSIGQRRFLLCPLADVKGETGLEALMTPTQPDAIAMSLCASRLAAFEHDASWRALDIITVIRQGRAFSFLAYLGFAAFSLRLGHSSDLLASQGLSETLAAARAADLPLRLLDRELESMLRLAWYDLSWWQRLVLVSRLTVSFLRRRLPGDAATVALAAQDPFAGALAALVAKEPRLADALLAQRDIHTAHTLLESQASTTLALLGPGRVHSVAALLRCDTLPHLRQPPPQRRVARSWLMPLLFASLLVPVYFLRHKLPLGSLLLGWTLINGACVLVVTALVGTRPLAILAGVVCAPFSIISPLLKASTAAAMTEALMRKPRLRDAERLPRDLRSWSGFRANPLCRVLLVFVAATVGSSLGTWVSVWWIAGQVLAAPILP